MICSIRYFLSDLPGFGFFAFKFEVGVAGITIEICDRSVC